MNVEPDVLTVLSNATIDGARLTLVGQLDRKLYERTNKVLVAAGGKWNRAAKAHVFAEDPAAVIDRVILTGKIDSARDDFEYFPTPPAVVAELIVRADLRGGLRVLEPSAGQGAIVHEVEKVCHVDCIELMPKNLAILTRLGYAASGGDFLTLPVTPIYDRVVMNPPFSRQADIKHVQRALEWLRPGGRLVSVMSAGVRFRGDAIATGFRALVDFAGGAIEPLPEGSFKSSGTNVSTVIVTIPT